MARERRSKFANDAKTAADIASQLAQNMKNVYVSMVDILNRDTAKSGYIDASGNPQPGSGDNWRYSDFIPVTAGKTYPINVKSSTGATLFTLEGTIYNSSKVVIGSLASQQMPYAWTAPANASYIVINYGTAYSSEVYFKEAQIVENIPSRWQGKKANFLGDSITFGAGVSTSERYSALVKNILGLAVENNYGINGTRLANNVTNSGADDSNAMCRRYTSMSNDADLIFVLAGTNDYGSGTPTSLKTAPFGTFTDTTDATFYGSLHVLYQGLINKYFGKTIVIITPLHRNGIGDSSSNDLKLNPDTNKNLRDYVNAIREVAEYYGLYVLDLYKELNINPIISTNKTTFMPDGLHPNGAGHQLIANAITNFVKRI
jgi:lysophospholipase L1-like esterase